MKSIHLPAVGALGMSIVGFIALNSATIAHYVPPQYAGAVLGAGLIAQFIAQSGKKTPPQALPAPAAVPVVPISPVPQVPIS